ncbi:hypothetical protein EV196_10336 [Mariniflexile fucanivorans]|uniref:Uncharacterized protein n=1 Tax=Mariniflexile fucanivorans TaxID=264023 RepID=A0A4V2QE37_9FLAO|nr:hypothetical protein [Mariniflexile fucanivorans]TCL66627.1 hypothetical protein EV196_10336 [Mariniflexile fucanivorans]
MKTKLSHNTILKFYNKQLSHEEMKHVGNCIDNSRELKNILNELEATYHLTNEKERLENNPYLFMEISNKLNKNKNQDTSYSTYLQRVFRPIMALSLVLLTLYTGYSIGNLASENSQQFTTQTYNSEFYFNDLQLEKMETVLLIKE